MKLIKSDDCLTIEIDGVMYEFKVTFGFLKKANDRVKKVDKSLTGINEKAIGFNMLAAGIMDGYIEDLVDILILMNSTCDPKIKRKDLEAFIEDDSTDIEELFQTVIDFLSKKNLTKYTMKKLLERAEAMMNQQ